ncbi:hypothetical protein [Longispora urticae]
MTVPSYPENPDPHRNTWQQSQQTAPGPAGPPAGQHSAQQVAVGQSSNAATRHLSAAAYLDDDFCQLSLAEIYHQPRRLVAPSHGFDLVTVLRHCLHARTVTLIRDGALAALLIGMACLSFPGLLSLATALIGFHLVVGMVRLQREALRSLRSGGGVSALVTIVLRSVQLVAVFGLYLLVSLIAFAATLGSMFVDPGTGDSAALPAGLSMVSTLLALVFVFVVSVGARVWPWTIVSQLGPGRSAVRPGPEDRRLLEIRRQEAGNTTVYSGFRPFIGSGEEIETTSFAQRLIRADPNPITPTPEAHREFDVAPFPAQDLIGYVHDRLSALRFDAEPERRIPGLTVEHRLFMAGTEMSALTSHLDAQTVGNVIRNPTAPVRHYLECRVVSWDGELVTNVYVHIAVQGRSLYVELSSWALAPCRDLYRSIDYVGNSGAMPYLRAIVSGFADAPRTLARAVPNLVKAGIQLIGASAAGEQTSGGTVQRGFDYGARWSMREYATDDAANNDFQLQDVSKYKKIVERRVVAAVLDFLESRDVDTTEYRQRAQAILNNGVLINGVSDSKIGPITNNTSGSPS